jgi:shikimate dehydrogenase
MVKIDKDTKRFFSVASSPGNFGATIYNHLFNELGINALYMPLGFSETASFHKILSALSLIKASGVSVSMPFKYDAWQQTVPPKEDISNVNTLIRQVSGHYYGYNTDIDGFMHACPLSNVNSATIIGRGAVSESIAFVLDKHKIPYRKFGGRNYSEDVYQGEYRDLLINATPMGMTDIPDDYFSNYIVSHHKTVFDVVVAKKTNLERICEEENVQYIPGYKMAMYQLIAQFELYTGCNPPKTLIKEKLIEMGYEV